MAGLGKTRQQDLFLGALLTTPTVQQAAHRAQISEATAARWLKDPAFAARVQAAKQQAFLEAVDFLKASMLGAVAVLRQVMFGEGTKPTTKVQAASKLLELGFRAHELYEFEQRLHVIEDVLLRRNGQ